MPSFGACAELPSPDSRIQSVLVVENEVFAADYHNLYRANFTDKIWNSIAPDIPLPTPGKFVQTTMSHPRWIYFYGPEHALGRPVTNVPKTAGLYVADRTGLTWKLASNEYVFKQVLQVSDGSLYAIGSALKGGARQDCIIRSRDEGRTWEDLTTNLSSLLAEPYKILFREPKNSKEISLRILGSRRDSVAHWQEAQSQWWIEDEEAWQARAGEFFVTPFSFAGVESVSDYGFDATFKNYFEFPFGDTTRLDPFELTLDRRKYEFKQGGAMGIAATLHFRREDHGAAAMDLAGTTDFWGLKIEDSEGDRFIKRPLVERRSASENYKQVEAAYNKKAALRKVELIRGKAYSRNVDLSELYHFRHKGVYKVQLIYSCPFWAGVGRARWTGSFGGPMFEVEIK